MSRLLLLYTLLQGLSSIVHHRASQVIIIFTLITTPHHQHTNPDSTPPISHQICKYLIQFRSISVVFYTIQPISPSHLRIQVLAFIIYNVKSLTSISWMCPDSSAHSLQCGGHNEVSVTTNNIRVLLFSYCYNNSVCSSWRLSLGGDTGRTFL